MVGAQFKLPRLASVKMLRKAGSSNLFVVEVVSHPEIMNNSKYHHKKLKQRKFKMQPYRCNVPRRDAELVEKRQVLSHVVGRLPPRALIRN